MPHMTDAQHCRAFFWFVDCSRCFLLVEAVRESPVLDQNFLELPYDATQSGRRRTVMDQHQLSPK